VSLPSIVNGDANDHPNLPCFSRAVLNGRCSSISRENQLIVQPTLGDFPHIFDVASTATR